MKAAMVERRRRIVALVLVLLFSLIQSNDAFLVIHTPQQRRQPQFQLFALPKIQDMRVKEMRAELDSYGISTRTFLEKKEFLDALEKARAANGASNGASTKSAKKAPDSHHGNKDAQAHNNNNKSSHEKSHSHSNQAGRSQQKANDTQKGKASTTRAQRLQAAAEKAKSMRVSELKQKLKQMGISTKSFFEKTEFVRAYAEAVVDGIGSDAQQQGFDPEYRDVVMQKIDPKTQSFLLGGSIIDIKL